MPAPRKPHGSVKAAIAQIPVGQPFEAVGTATVNNIRCAAWHLGLRVKQRQLPIPRPPPSARRFEITILP